MPRIYQASWSMICCSMSSTGQAAAQIKLWTSLSLVFQRSKIPKLALGAPGASSHASSDYIMLPSACCMCSVREALATCSSAVAYIQAASGNGRGGKGPKQLGKAHGAVPPFLAVVLTIQGVLLRFSPRQETPVIRA